MRHALLPRVSSQVAHILQGQIRHVRAAILDAGGVASATLQCVRDAVRQRCSASEMQCVRDAPHSQRQGCYAHMWRLPTCQSCVMQRSADSVCLFASAFASSR